MFDAMSLDTSTLRAAGYKFDSGILSNLKQFRSGTTQLVLSEIVIREAYRHILLDEKERKRALQSFAKRLTGIERYSDLQERIQSEADELDPVVIATERINKFVVDTGATLLSVGNASIEEISRAYFNSTPPFEKTGKKKSEFPDAIALYSLRNWATENSKKLLVAAQDTDWMRFAENEPCLQVHAELSDVLVLAQNNVDQATEIAQNFVESLSEPSVNADTFWDELEYVTGSIDIIAQADSAMQFEEDYIEIEVNPVDLVENVRSDTIAIVRVGSSDIAFSIKIDVSINATAYFNLFVYDSIDKDNVYLGGTSATVDGFDFVGEYIVTLSGDIKGPPEELVVQSIDILDHPDAIYFGHIELDHGDDDWDPSDDLQLEFFENSSPSESDSDVTPI